MKKMQFVLCELLFLWYTPEFDSFMTKQVPKAALEAACGTCFEFTVARYAVCFWSGSKYFSFY